MEEVVGTLLRMIVVKLKLKKLLGGKHQEAIGSHRGDDHAG